jgi:preprotein translocase subunit YajC
VAVGPFLVAPARLAEYLTGRVTLPGVHQWGIVVEKIAFTVLLLAADEGGGSMLPMLLMFGVPLLFFWALLLRPQQQERKRRQGMLAALKKNDRVITIGGIYGVVTNVHRDSEEEAIRDVTIKVDESSNVKLRVTIGSIARVLVDRESGDDSSK